MGLQVEVEQLFERQLREWPLVQRNYAALDDMAVRVLTLPCGSNLVLQFNPERVRSNAAAVDAASLASRPCFLCAEHQPSAQESIRWREHYKVQVNPYPIFSRHLTISLQEHVPQQLSPQRLDDMVYLATELPGFVVFYNGAQCGASAPHHFHFQAGLKGLMPLCDEADDEALWPIDSRIESRGDGFLGFSQRWGRFFFMARAQSPTLLLNYMARIMLAMVRATGNAHPMVNVLCWTAGEHGNALFFPRGKHRPSCYGDGPGQLLVSPASVEMGGLWTLVRKSDYDDVTPQRIQQVYDELMVDNATAVRMIEMLSTNEL